VHSWRSRTAWSRFPLSVLKNPPAKSWHCATQETLPSGTNRVDSYTLLKYVSIARYCECLLFISSATK